MLNEIIKKLNLIEQELDPYNPEHLRDILYIVVQNINILHNEEDEVNLILGRILTKIFATKEENCIDCNREHQQHFSRDDARAIQTLLNKVMDDRLHPREKERR